MADRTDFYFRQRVTEAELDLAFELLEKADRNLAADIGVYGIISGADPLEHEPVADLTVDLLAPGRAYDHLGQRIFFGTDQTVDCSVDLNGLPTEVASSGNERWLGVFLKFDRQLSDSRTDGNSQQVFFRRDESFKIVVRQAPEGPVGGALKVPLVEDELLVCDVLRRAGQTQIVTGDIDTARRQAFVFAQGDFVEIISGLWNTISPSANTVQSALDSVDDALSGHFAGTSHQHAAAHVGSEPHGFITGDTVQSALSELVDKLSSGAMGSAGASLVGAAAISGTPNGLPAGNVGGQLSQLLGWLNNHVGASGGAHNASGVAAQPHNHIIGTSVQAQLQEIVTDLAQQAGAGGANLVGAVQISGTPNALPAATLAAQLSQLLSFINHTETTLGTDHNQSGEPNSGHHKTIHQPALPGSRVLLWDSFGAGGSGGHLRVYCDSSTVYFTLNAAWNGLRWQRDDTNLYSGGFRFSRSLFEFMHEDTFAAEFTNWSATWRLPMADANNSALETTGTIQETGRLSMYGTNTNVNQLTIAMGGAVTFRSRFPTTPSSITLAPLATSSSWVGPPSISYQNRDGFGFVGYQSVLGYYHAYWHGSYTAIA